MKECVKCQGTRVRKQGFSKGRQKYRCVACGAVSMNWEPAAINLEPVYRGNPPSRKKELDADPALAAFRRVAEQVLASQRTISINKSLFSRKQTK